MAEFRRIRVPGGTYFFTLVTRNRFPLFDDARAREMLGGTIRNGQHDWPFTIDAMVLLPDHLHAIWTLPRGDTNYSARLSWIKKEFTKAWLASGGAEQTVSERRQIRGVRGVWQPRFWEHTIEDDEDFATHFDYVHYNPVKHGLVKCPKDWLYSTFHRWVGRGVYSIDWACGQNPPPQFPGLDTEAME